MKFYEGKKDHRIPERKLDLKMKMEKICQLVDFVVPIDHRVKCKAVETLDKYQCLQDSVEY